MILASAVVLGLIASIIRHRSNTPNRIAAIRLYSAWLAPLALALQWPLLRAPAQHTHDLAAQQVLFLLSYLLLLIFVWRNWHLLGIRILGLGVICNLAVILANGGLMPITPETLAHINPGSAPEQWLFGTHYSYSKDIILTKEASRLRVLSDMLVLPPPFPRPTAFSVGDLVIAVGIVITLQGQKIHSS
jgi:hypothetical protein